VLPLYMQDAAALTISRADAHPLVKHHALAVVLFGYTVIRNCFAPSHCNSVIARFRQFEAANQHIFAPHRDDNGHLPRVVNLHLAMPELISLFSLNTVLLAVQDLLFGRPTSLYTSLFYERGSQQQPHRDTPVFCTRPEYLYFGNTVYLEAAGDENGCLEVIEGGHTVGELDREALARARYGSLDDIPQLDNDIWIEYQRRVTDRCDRLNLARRLVAVEAGDAVIWHPQLPHGGSAIRDASRTRLSFVFHTTPVGVPVYHQHAFFHPSAPMPETAAWDYRWVDGRAIADHRNGIALGEPVHQQFSFDQLNI
jgi:phytanoyl-CoA hydroxylase